MTPRGVAGMAIHLGPSVARRVGRGPTWEGWAAPLPPPTFPPTGAPPIWPCSGGVARFHSPEPGSAPPLGTSLWHWSLHGRAGVTRHPAPRSLDFPHTTDGHPHRRRATIRTASTRPSYSGLSASLSWPAAEPHSERDRTTAAVEDHPSRWIGIDTEDAPVYCRKSPACRLIADRGRPSPSSPSC
jgi:hypothetical protein